MTTDYSSEIYDKLVHIRSSFIQKNMQASPYFGAFTSAAFAADSLPGRLLTGYTSGFSRSYASSVRSGLTNATLAAGVKYRADLATRTYAQIPAEGSVPIASTLPGNRYVDLNLSALLDAAASDPKLADELNNVAILYSLLDDANYATYVQGGTPLKITKYTSPGAVVDYTLDNAVTKTYMEGTDQATRIDRLISNLTGASLATTASIPIGRYTSPDRNSATALTNEVLPPTGSTDVIVSLSPVSATATFETISPAIPLQAPTAATGVSATYNVRGSVKLIAPTGAIPAGTTTPFAIYLRRGNTMVQLGTVASPSAASWTSFSYNTTALTAADSPLELVLVYTHNKTWTKLLITNFSVTSVLSGESAAGNPGAIFAPETDLFVVRRLLLLYTLMSNFYIAMTAYDRMYVAGSTAEPATARNLLSLTYQNITELNRNTIRSGDLADNSDGISNISKLVNERTRDFYSMGANLNTLSEKTTDNKIMLRDDLQRMATTGAVKERSQRYSMATIAIALVIVLGLTLVFVTPSSPLVKVTGTAAVLVAAIILNLAITKLYAGNVAETFGTDPPGALVYSLPAYPGGLDTSNKLSIIQYYESSFMKEVSEYLGNTIYLSLLLQSHKAYGNINFSMKKEERYFTDAVDQMETQRKKVRDTSGLLRLDQITERARMTLTLSVLIIVSAASFAVMLLRLRFPGLIPFVLIVAAVLLASALFFYVMDTNARVRTNGAQRYWQQPEMRAT